MKESLIHSWIQSLPPVTLAEREDKLSPIIIIISFHSFSSHFFCIILLTCPNYFYSRGFLTIYTEDEFVSYSGTYVHHKSNLVMVYGWLVS